MNIPGRLIRPNFNSQQAIYICKFLIMQQHQHIHVLVPYINTVGSIYLYFPSVLYNKLPSLTWRNIYMATVPVISFQFSPYYCAILENNDMTEPFPWKMLVKVLMLLLLVSTSRCFSNYILTHSSKHVELHLLNIDHTPFLLVPRNFRTFSLVEDMRGSQVSTRTLGCMHSLIRTQILDLRMRSANPQPDAIITKTLY